MINKTLTYIKNYLAEKIGSYGEVNFGAMNRDGQIVDSDILITLVHIEEERSVKSAEHYRYIKNENGEVTGVVNVNPEIRINLYVLISSRKEPYETALTLISKVIAIFQSKNAFRRSDFKDMSGVDMGEIESITLDLHPLTFEQNNSLWQTLGVTLMPSVLYKIRALVVKDVITMYEETKPILPEEKGGGISLNLIHTSEKEIEPEKKEELSDK